jgi:hypothetical protein
MARCKRSHTVRHVPGAAAGAAVSIDSSTVEYLIRAVDAAGTPLAWSYAVGSIGGDRFHLAAGESLTEERLAMENELALWVFSAAGSTIEIAEWQE